MYTLQTHFALGVVFTSLVLVLSWRIPGQGVLALHRVYLFTSQKKRRPRPTRHRLARTPAPSPLAKRISGTSQAPLLATSSLPTAEDGVDALRHRRPPSSTYHVASPTNMRGPAAEGRFGGGLCQSALGRGAGLLREVEHNEFLSTSSGLQSSYLISAILSHKQP